VTAQDFQTSGSELKPILRRFAQKPSSSNAAAKKCGQSRRRPLHDRHCKLHDGARPSGF
jgi:hypothetical protein